MCRHVPGGHVVLTCNGMICQASEKALLMTAFPVILRAGHVAGA